MTSHLKKIAVIGLGYVGRLSSNILEGSAVNDVDNNMLGIGANSDSGADCWFPELGWTLLPGYPNIKADSECN